MLYQLSYASPIPPEKERPETRNRAGTLPLRTHNGTVSMVNTERAGGQTEEAGKMGSQNESRLPQTEENTVDYAE